MHPAFLTAEWRKLAMANYVIDPGLLKRCLPYKTELDVWNGTCYVSLAGFMFMNTRLKGIRISWYTAWSGLFVLKTFYTVNNGQISNWLSREKNGEGRCRHACRLLPMF